MLVSERKLIVVIFLKPRKQNMNQQDEHPKIKMKTKISFNSQKQTKIIKKKKQSDLYQSEPYFIAELVYPGGEG